MAGGRGGGQTTGRMGVPDEVAFGSDAEKARRLEDGYPATESHFSQIRPARGRRSFDDINGRKQGANATVKRNGKV